MLRGRVQFEVWSRARLMASREPAPRLTPRALGCDCHVGRCPGWDRASRLLRAVVRLAAREDLLDPLPDQRLPSLRIEPDRYRRTVDPAELDEVRCFTLHCQQASMKGSVVASAEDREIAYLVTATAGLFNNMMNFQIPCRAAARHGATMV